MNPETFGVTPDLGSPSSGLRLVITGIFLAAAILARFALARLISRRDGALNERQRWWLATTRNTANGFMVVGTAVIWAPELGNLALSIAAFAAALVIATKELILCVSGALWRGATRPFGIGDWVEIGAYSGEVIDETLMATELLEIDRTEFRHTGRTIYVPNSALLAAPVINQNFRKRFLLHEFTLHSEPNPDAPAVRDAIAAALAEASKGFTETARRYAGVIERRTGVTLPESRPVVRLGTSETGKITFRCALFCPRDRTAEIEQVAMLAWLAAGGAVAIGELRPRPAAMAPRSPPA
jgi:small-conductance mechanosensitive channel